MRSLSRRGFLAGAGAVAGAVGLPGIDISSAMAASGPAQGAVRDQGGEVFDVRSPAYGVKGDTVIAPSGSMTAGSKTLVAATATFVAGDVGKVMTVQGAGPTARVLSSTIASYVGPSVVNLTSAASTGVSSAEFAFGTDDTQALLAAVAAAGPLGRLYVPAGIYMLRGASNGGRPIEVSGAGGLLGAGGSGSGAQMGNTVFLCGDETAGILANGSGTFESFQCHGNNIGLVPMQNGSVVDGVAVGNSRGAVFLAIWTFASAGDGWTIRGAQNNTYIGCRSRLNRGAGYHIDGGAGGLHFWWLHAVHNRIDIVGDKLVPGGKGTHGDHTEDVRFQSGICDSSNTLGPRESKVRLRGATNWTFSAMALVGTSANPAATVDLDQSEGYGIDFTGSLIFARGQQPAIRVNGAPPAGSKPRAFLITDDVKWIGNNSVHVSEAGSYHYSARGWMVEKPPRGPVGGPGIDTLLTGRTGSWLTPTLAPGWTSNARYRVSSDGVTQLKGSATFTGAGPSGQLFTLLPGYRPARVVTMPVAHSAGVGCITVAPDGVVSAPDVATDAVVYLDGVSLPRA